MEPRFDVYQQRDDETRYLIVSAGGAIPAHLAEVDWIKFSVDREAAKDIADTVARLGFYVLLSGKALTSEGKLGTI